VCLSASYRLRVAARLPRLCEGPTIQDPPDLHRGPRARREVSTWSPFEPENGQNTQSFHADTPFCNSFEWRTLGNRPSYVSYNSVHYVDPSGYKWSWKKFFAIAAAVVVGVVTGQLELPGIVAAAFSAATVAAATAEGAAIDRLSERQGSVSAVLPTSSPGGPPSSFPSLGQTLSQVATSVLTPAYNTLTRPGWNYGLYFSELDAGKGLLNRSLPGALLDSAWFASGVYGAIELAASRALLVSPATVLAPSSKVIPRQTTVLGSRADTLAFKGQPGYNVLDIPNWTLKKNIKWLDSAFRRGDILKIVTDPSTWKAANPQSAFFQELKYLAWRLRGTIDYGQ